MLARLFDDADKPGAKKLPFLALAIPQIAHVRSSDQVQEQEVRIDQEPARTVLIDELKDIGH